MTLRLLTKVAKNSSIKNTFKVRSNREINMKHHSHWNIKRLKITLRLKWWYPVNMDHRLLSMSGMELRHSLYLSWKLFIVFLEALYLCSETHFISSLYLEILELNWTYRYIDITIMFDVDIYVLDLIVHGCKKFNVRSACLNYIQLSWVLTWQLNVIIFAKYQKKRME